MKKILHIFLAFIQKKENAPAIKPKDECKDFYPFLSICLIGVVIIVKNTFGSFTYKPKYSCDSFTAVESIQSRITFSLMDPMAPVQHYSSVL